MIAIFGKQLTSHLQTIILSDNPAQTALSEFDPCLDSDKELRLTWYWCLPCWKGENQVAAMGC